MMAPLWFHLLISFVIASSQGQHLLPIISCLSALVQLSLQACYYYWAIWWGKLYILFEGYKRSDYQNHKVKSAVPSAYSFYKSGLRFVGIWISGYEYRTSIHSFWDSKILSVVEVAQERSLWLILGHTGLVVKFWRFFILYVYPIFVYPTTVQVLEVFFHFVYPSPRIARTTSS